MHRQLCKWICPSTLSKDLCNFSKDGKGLLKWRKLFVSQRKELKIRIIVDFTMMSSFHGETPKGRYKKHPSQHKTSIVKCQISRLFGYIEIGSDVFESGRRIRITVHVMSQPPVCHVWCGFVSMLSNGELFCGLSNHVEKVIHLLAEFSRWLTAKRTPDGFDWKRMPDEQYNSRSFVMAWASGFKMNLVTGHVQCHGGFRTENKRPRLLAHGLAADGVGCSPSNTNCWPCGCGKLFGEGILA